jgi:hypothetical protein
MGTKSINGSRLKTQGDPVRHHTARRGQLVKRKDGTIVEMRPGFRPRVLSQEEVEALKAVAPKSPPVGADADPLGLGASDA